VKLDIREIDQDLLTDSNSDQGRTKIMGTLNKVLHTFCLYLSHNPLNIYRSEKCLEQICGEKTNILGPVYFLRKS
jgi:hypothetical protein